MIKTTTNLDLMRLFVIKYIVVMEMKKALILQIQIT